MNVLPFRKWLGDGRYTVASANTRFSYAKKVEEAYGDLDEQFERDGLKELVGLLAYSLTDAKLDRPNPTKIAVNGNPYNVLNNCKTGVKSYREFLETGGTAQVVEEEAIEIAGAAIASRREGKQFELERHLQESLRAEISQLERGLSIIDGDVERSVESGSIDILARDAAGGLVVIELKRGEAKRDAIGQILGYMGDLKIEEPDSVVRGIIVAAEFDRSCRSAVAAVPSLALRRYRYAFQFESI